MTFTPRELEVIERGVGALERIADVLERLDEEPVTFEVDSGGTMTRIREVKD